MALPVRELELDLDAFEGPFDLLLTLVLRDEIPLREIELPALLEPRAERDHDLGHVDLREIELLLEDERQQQVERPGEDLQVEIEIGDQHRAEG